MDYNIGVGLLGNTAPRWVTETSIHNCSDSHMHT